MPEPESEVGPYRVINHDSWKIHYARGRREDIAATLPPEDVTAENWWHWRTLCGRDLIGRKTDEDVNCARCIKSIERARKTYAELEERLGVR